MDYKSKYYKYKLKYKNLKKLIGGGDMQIYINDERYTYYYKEDSVIQDLILFINNKLESNRTEFTLGNYLKPMEKIIINVSNANNKIKDIFTGNKYNLLPPPKQIGNDDISRKIFTKLLVTISKKIPKYDKIIISEFSCNIEPHISAIDKNITQQFQPHVFGSENNIVIILYDKLFFRNKYNIQFYELIKNIKEVSVEEDIRIGTHDKIKKFVYDIYDRRFIAKTDTEYNHKYIEKLNKTGMQNKNIIFYVLNHELVLDDDYPQKILHDNNIDNIDIYYFEGEKI